MSLRQPVIFDNMTIDLLADIGLDPIEDLRHSEFEIICTPDLREEYIQASENAKSSAARELAARMAKAARTSGIFGFDGPPFAGFDEGNFPSPEQEKILAAVRVKDRPGKIPQNRTDSHLVALAEWALVVTNNTNDSHWKLAPSGRGRLIWWEEFLPKLRQHKNVALALRDCMPSDTNIFLA